MDNIDLNPRVCPTILPPHGGTRGPRRLPRSLYVRVDFPWRGRRAAGAGALAICLANRETNRVQRHSVRSASVCCAVLCALSLDRGPERSLSREEAGGRHGDPQAILRRWGQTRCREHSTRYTGNHWQCSQTLCGFGGGSWL